MSLRQRRTRPLRYSSIEALEDRNLLTGFAAAFGGAGFDRLWDMQGMDDGTTVVTGSFSATANFGPLQLSSAGDKDGFVAKLDSAGNVLWAQRFGGSGEDRGYDVAIDSQGNVLVTGLFNDVASFGSDSILSKGGSDVFATKLNASGEFQWTRAFGGSTNDGRSQQIAAAPNDEILVRTPSNFGPLLIKLDANGNDIWTKTASAPGTLGLAVDSAGNIYTGGTFDGSSESGKLTRLSATGEVDWQIPFPKIDGLAVDANGLYGTGRFNASLTAGNPSDPGYQVLQPIDGYDAFFTEIHRETGAVQWVETLGGQEDQIGRRVALNPNGNIVFVGSIEGTSHIAGEALNSQGGTDGFIIELTSEGNVTSTKSVGGSQADEDVRNASVDANGNLYVGGYFDGPVGYFDGQALTSSGDFDAFVGKIPAAQPTKFFVVDSSTDRTFEYSEDGGSVEDYRLTSGNNAPRGATSNQAGDTVWVIDGDRYVYIYDESGAEVGRWKANSIRTPEGIATDGTHIWITDRRTDRVYYFANAAAQRSGQLSPTSSFKLDGQNRNPRGITTDGQRLWVVNDTNSADRVFQYNTSGSLTGSWNLNSGNRTPRGITIEPGNPDAIWIVDSSTDQVFEYQNGANQTSGNGALARTFDLNSNNNSPQGIADPPVSDGDMTPRLSLDLTRHINPIPVVHQAVSNNLALDVNQVVTVEPGFSNPEFNPPRAQTAQRSVERIFESAELMQFDFWDWLSMEEF